MDILNRARRQARAVPAAAGGQLAVELCETGRGDGLKPQLADLRPDMPVLDGAQDSDDPGVVAALGMPMGVGG